MIIEKLKRFRIKQKLTQEELAKLLGVSFSTCTKWLGGKTYPSLRSQRLIDALISTRANKITKETK